MIFEVKIGVVILVTPKQEVERKSEWFCGVNFFALNLKQSEKKVLEQKFAFSLVVFLFTCGNLTLSFTVFSILWIGFF